MKKKATKLLRNLVLVLGDQLNIDSAAFDGFDPSLDAVWMAEVGEEAKDAIESIKGRRLLEGYRGNEPVNMERLAQLIVAFSQIAFDMRKEVESIDLNPVLCDREAAMIADARFMLKK